MLDRGAPAERGLWGNAVSGARRPAGALRRLTRPGIAADKHLAAAAL